MAWFRLSLLGYVGGIAGDGAIGESHMSEIVSGDKRLDRWLASNGFLSNPFDNF